MHIVRIFAALLPVLVCVFGCAMPDARARAGVEFVIAHHWPVGGTGGWDYLAIDPTGRHLFVTRGNRVDVIDTASGTVTGSIADTAGVHGVAFAPEFNRGYTSNGRAGSVTAFELGSLRELSRAKVSGMNPDAIVYEPIGKHILTFNGASSNATVLDAMTLAVIATIGLPDKPEFAVVDGAGRVFANIESEQGQLVAIDAKALKVQSIWQLPGCASPTGLALDRAHERLFSVCANKVMVVTDAVSGRHVASVAIGAQPDAAAFDASLGLVFSSNGEGTLTVIREDDADHYRVVSTLATQRSARTLALDPRSHRVYLVAAEFAPQLPDNPGAGLQRPSMLPDSFAILVAAPRQATGE